MANDDETLTFRIRATAEGLGAFRKTAAAAEDVNKSTAKATKLADALAGANKKLNVVRDREADALGKVRVAETKVKEVRSNVAAKTSQIAAAEERLLTARRNAARASNDVQKIESEFRNLASKTLTNDSEKIGRNSGKKFSGGFLGFLKRDAASNFQRASELIGRSFGSGIGSGLETALKTQAGPLILGVLIGVVAVVAPAIGAVLASGIVAGFGAGIVTLGIVFAAKSQAVRTKWSNVMQQMGADTQLLAKPFESVLIHIADFAARTFAKFNPALKAAFARSAGPIQNFVDQAGRALEKLIPAIAPISIAFNAMLKSLGPGLQSALNSVANGLITISQSVLRNPTGLADFIAGIGDLFDELSAIIGILNDADGAFRRLTGGTSLVKVTFEGMKAAIDAVATPLVLLAKYVGFVSDTINALSHNTNASGASMSDAASKTAGLATSLGQTGAAAAAANPTLKSTHEIAEANAKSAAAAKKAFEDWITQLFRLQQINMTVAQSQLALHESITKATESLKENGRGFNLNTKAGQSNQSTLLAVASAIQAQTEANIRAKQPMAVVAITAGKQRASFIALGIQMGKTPAQAKAMADALISIPNVTRRATLTANKVDLERKLAAAKRSLNDKDLTRERRAQINANIAALQRKLQQAQADINAIHGKTIEIKYTSNGINLTAPGASRVAKATGGKIYGPGSGTSDSVPAMLSNKEWVIKAKSSQKYGDHAMASVNAGTAQIVPQGFASGGEAQLGIHTRNLFQSEAQGKAYLDKLIGGPAMAFAKSQVGKPYVWGGVGPGGYDCSGFMSAIVNVIQGRSPHTRRFATGSLPAGLFQRGSGRFNIGWFKGNPGHTAGTLNGVNVESRGGRGVVVGGGARGAGDRLFNSGIWHLKGYARGGKAGDPPFDGFGKWLENLTPHYKQGTPYVPQTGPAWLHQGERVIPAGSNRDAKLTFEFKSDGTPYMEWLIGEFRKYIRGQYQGDVTAALGGKRG